MNPLFLAMTLGCAPAPHAGELVQIADEQAVIVWNEQAKVEHFIRRAHFATDAKDFGFLVPTPTKPTLAAVDDSIFTRLIAATKPEEKIETGVRLEPSLACLWTMARKSTAVAPAEQHVAVLELARVAGYDAAVLAADDAIALGKWLDEHGYPASEALKSWLDVYVKQKWIVTAFKIARGPSETPSADVGTSAVRMTFATDKPFYPYREPEGQTGPSRILEVFLVAPAHMDGTVGSSPWPSTTLYARKEIDVAPLLAGVPDLPARAWLHRFVDFSSPRRGTDDLFFDRSTAGEVVPPPILIDRRIAIPLPLDLIALLLAGIALTVRLLRRKTA